MNMFYPTIHTKTNQQLIYLIIERVGRKPIYQQNRTNLDARGNSKCVDQTYVGVE